MRGDIATGPKSYNLSARGLEVSLYYCEEISDVEGDWLFEEQGATGWWQKCHITDFPSDTDPLSVDRISFAKVERDINGEIYRISQNPIYSVSLSLIPGSEPDKSMMSFIDTIVTPQEGMVDVSTQSRPMYIFLMANYPLIGRKKVFCKGFFTGMTPGFSATSEGRIASHVYSFDFKSIVDR